MRRIPGFTSAVRGLHRDERGAVTIETILIIGAVALPVLIFLLRFGWPVIRDFFVEGESLLERESDRVSNGG
jgi:hypothetical protein